MKLPPKTLLKVFIFKSVL